jgi:hypothetical protein
MELNFVIFKGVPDFRPIKEASIMEIDNNEDVVPPSSCCYTCSPKADVERFDEEETEEINERERSPIPLLAAVAGHRLVAKHWANTPILNALRENGRAIDSLGDGGALPHGLAAGREDLLNS